jgi:hypothetical protein
VEAIADNIKLMELSMTSTYIIFFECWGVKTFSFLAKRRIISMSKYIKVLKKQRNAGENPCIQKARIHKEK